MSAKTGQGSLTERFNSRKSSQSPSCRDVAYCSSAIARELVPVDVALSLNALPLAVITTNRGRTLTAALPKDRQEEVKLQLRFLTDCAVIGVVLPREVVNEAIFVAYFGDPDQFASSLSRKDESSPKVAEPYQAVTPDKFDFLDQLLHYVAARGASDVHLTPEKQGYYIRMRVHGELLSHSSPLERSGVYESMLRRLKVLAQLPLSPSSLPLEARFSYQLPTRALAIRVSLIPTLYGERVALRLLDTNEQPQLDELGYPSPVLEWIESAIRKPEGLILIGGATGSGKTTTLYAIAKALHDRGRSVITLEDPVERVVPGVAQIQLDGAAGFNIAKAFTGALRQDPDALMLGEIRTESAAQALVQASLSGHLVVSTTHAGGVLQALTRLKVLGASWDALCESLLLVVVQRLIPQLCNYCKVINLRDSHVAGFEIYQSVGCQQCNHSGFEGQVLATEVLRFDKQLRCSLRDGVDSAQEIIEESGRWYSFREAEERLLRAGQIVGVRRDGTC